MLEPRGGLWSSGSVSDSQNREWNNQKSVVAVAVVAVVVVVVVVVRWW